MRRGSVLFLAEVLQRGLPREDTEYMQNPDSSYAKPFLSIPAQIRRLRTRGMDCGSDEFAAAMLERYGYYRLSGYWHPYRQFRPAPAPALDAEGRERRLDTFRPGTKPSLNYRSLTPTE